MEDQQLLQQQQILDALKKVQQLANRMKSLDEQRQQQDQMKQEYIDTITQEEFDKMMGENLELKEPDVQIKVNRVQDILDQGFYPVQYRFEDNIEKSLEKKNEFRQNAKRGNISIAVTGQLKKGKSFIQSRLSEQPLRVAQNIRTMGIQGMFAKYISNDGTSQIDHRKLYIDTEGTMEPLQVYEEINEIFLKIEELKKNNQFQDSKYFVPRLAQNSELDALQGQRDKELKEVDKNKNEQLISSQVWEIFLQQFLLEKCNIIICVVGQMNQDEQIQINRIIEMQNNEKNKKQRKKVIVLHNWSKFVTWDQVVSQQVKDIEKCYHISKKEKIGNIKDGDKDREVYYFQEQRNELKLGDEGLLEYDSQFQTVEHFSLIHQQSDLGQKYNKIVIEKLREIIDQHRDNSPWILEEKFAEFCSENLHKYLKLKPFLNLNRLVNSGERDDREGLKEGLAEYLLLEQIIEKRGQIFQGKQVDKYFYTGTQKEYQKAQLINLAYTYVERKNDQLTEKIISPVYSMKNYLSKNIVDPNDQLRKFIELCKNIKLHKDAQLLIPPEQVSVVPIVPRDIRIRYLVLPDVNQQNNILLGKLKIVLEAAGVEENPKDQKDLKGEKKFLVQLKQVSGVQDKEVYDLTFKCRKRIPDYCPIQNSIVNEKFLDRSNSQLIAEGEIIQTIQIYLKKNIIPLEIQSSAGSVEKADHGVFHIFRQVKK